VHQKLDEIDVIQVFAREQPLQQRVVERASNVWYPVRPEIEDPVLPPADENLQAYQQFKGGCPGNLDPVRNWFYICRTHTQIYSNRPENRL
jgi:hypothetical protein